MPFKVSHRPRVADVCLGAEHVCLHVHEDEKDGTDRKQLIFILGGQERAQLQRDAATPDPLTHTPQNPGDVAGKFLQIHEKNALS